MSFATWSIGVNLIRLLPFQNQEFISHLNQFYGVTAVLFLSAGWISEYLLGRYRAITIGNVLLTVSHLGILTSLVLLQFDWTVAAFVAMCLSLSVAAFGSGTFYISSLPFIVDQMIGASADDISAAIQWYCWAIAVGVTAQSLPTCLSIVTQQQNISYFYLSLSILSLSSVLITDSLCHKWLDIHYKRSNPFKTIFKVLNYARKTKYPEHRSAFTYIDEEEPSRLDYGKHKFGGPFTEEEVENVKTILRLLLLLLSAFGALLIVNDLEFGDYFQIHVISTNKRLIPCIKRLRKLSLYASGVIMLPVYRFILFPLLHNRFQSLIKRVGIGLAMIFISTLSNLTMDTIGHLDSNNTHCMFDAYSAEHITISIPLYWLILSDIVFGVGGAIISVNLIVFVLAQSPQSMRGVMMGVLFTLLCFAIVVNYGLHALFRHFNNAFPSCGFYYYLVLLIILILSLVLFTIAAKRYKLRERERHVNVQAIAEEHYERYLDQEEEHMREIAKMYKTNTVTVK